MVERPPSSPWDLPELTPLVELSTVRICQWGPLIIQDWRQEPLAHDLGEVYEVFEDVIRRLPGGFSVLALIRPPQLLSSPDANVREHSRRQLQRIDPHTRAHAIVIEMPGLSGKTARTFMRAVVMLSKAKTPIRLFSGLEPALDWIVTVEDVAPVLVTERARLGAAIADWWG